MKLGRGGGGGGGLGFRVFRGGGLLFEAPGAPELEKNKEKAGFRVKGLGFGHFIV